MNRGITARFLNYARPKIIIGEGYASHVIDPKSDFYTCMEGRDTLPILLALRAADEPLILKDLSGTVPNNTTLRSTLDDMEEDGLVDLIVVINGGRRCITVNPTDTGRDATLLLSVANNLVSPSKSIRDKCLGQRHFDTIVRVLHKKKYVIQMEIMEYVKSYDSAKRVLDAMEEDGLLVRVVDTTHRKEIRYSLTDLGEQIAGIYQAVWEKIDSVRIRG